MKFIDDAAVDSLAKSSTILQCMVQLLDFECSKYHVQAELIDAENNTALINCDPMTPQQILEVCKKVSSQFKRKDGKFSCLPKENNEIFVVCEAGKLEDYCQVN
jgi:hypothetical protein